MIWLISLCLWFFSPSPAAEKAYGNEVLAMDSLWLNGKLPVEMYTSNLVSYFGQPDSITPYTGDCAHYFTMTDTGEPVEWYYYPQGVFLVQGGRAVWKEIRFSMTLMAPLLVKHPRLELSGMTTLTDLEKILPESARHPEYNNDPTGEGLTQTVSVMPTPFSFDRWLLVFANNRLVRLVYISRC